MAKQHKVYAYWHPHEHELVVQEGVRLWVQKGPPKAYSTKWSPRAFLMQAQQVLPAAKRKSAASFVNRVEKYENRQLGEVILTEIERRVKAGPAPEPDAPSQEPEPPVTWLKPDYLARMQRYVDRPPADEPDTTFKVKTPAFNPELAEQVKQLAASVQSVAPAEPKSLAVQIGEQIGAALAAALALPAVEQALTGLLTKVLGAQVVAPTAEAPKAPAEPPKLILPQDSDLNGSALNDTPEPATGPEKPPLMVTYGREPVAELPSPVVTVKPPKHNPYPPPAVRENKPRVAILDIPQNLRSMYERELGYLCRLKIWTSTDNGGNGNLNQLKHYALNSDKVFVLKSGLKRHGPTVLLNQLKVDYIDHEGGGTVFLERIRTWIADYLTKNPAVVQ